MMRDGIRYWRRFAVSGSPSVIPGRVAVCDEFRLEHLPVNFSLEEDCMINMELRNSVREIQNKRVCGMESKPRRVAISCKREIRT